MERKNFIRQARRNFQVSQVQLAGFIGKSHTYVSMLELGKLTIDQQETDQIIQAIKIIGTARRAGQVAARAAEIAVIRAAGQV